MLQNPYARSPSCGWGPREGHTGRRRVDILPVFQIDPVDGPTLAVIDRHRRVMEAGDVKIQEHD